MAPAAGYSFHWKVSPTQGIIRKTEKMARSLPRVVEDEMYALGERVLQWMRSNHPWQNISGDAERGLSVTRITGGFRIAHGVFYGIFLELKHAGRWGVIRPAMTWAQSQIKPAMERAIQRVLYGG